MYKLFTLLSLITTLLIAGCSTHTIPGVYRPTIQQGNVVTQEQVNQLQPEMSKHQVKFILGTPLLVDVFHQDRWDYLYTMKSDGDPQTKERIALFFQDDRLVRIEGDYRPKSVADPLTEQESLIHTVPDYKDREKSLFSKAADTVGLGGDEPQLRDPVTPEEAGEEMVTERDISAAEDKPVPTAAPVEESSDPLETLPDMGKTYGDPIEAPNQKAVEPAPVDSRLESMRDSSPTGE